jgi:hypothetical protein
LLITQVKPDGLYINTAATLHRLIGDEHLQQFATGLVVNAITEAVAAENHLQTVHAVLFEQTGTFNGLLVACLALDAELKTVINDQQRIFTLAGFFSYRDRLAEIPLPLLRFPSLNPDGHYLFAVIDQSSYMAVRLDLHPGLGVAGHVRIALGGAQRLPTRLRAIENRLERQVLTPTQIEKALLSENIGTVPVLSPTEREQLSAILHRLRDQQ